MKSLFENLVIIIIIKVEYSIGKVGKMAKLASFSQDLTAKRRVVAEFSIGILA